MADYTPLLQKSRVLQLQGAKGEAVVLYRDPLATPKMRRHRFSRRVKNRTTYYGYPDTTTGEFLKQNRIVAKGMDGLHLTSFWHIFYATLGYTKKLKSSYGMQAVPLNVRDAGIMKSGIALFRAFDLLWTAPSNRNIRPMQFSSKPGCQRLFNVEWRK